MSSSMANLAVKCNKANYSCLPTLTFTMCRDHLYRYYLFHTNTQWSIRFTVHYLWTQRQSRSVQHSYLQHSVKDSSCPESPHSPCFGCSRVFNVRYMIRLRTSDDRRLLGGAPKARVLCVLCIICVAMFSCKTNVLLPCDRDRDTF